MKLKWMWKHAGVGKFISFYNAFMYSIIYPLDKLYLKYLEKFNSNLLIRDNTMRMPYQQAKFFWMGSPAQQSTNLN